jgi:hypothetical protein
MSIFGNKACARVAAAEAKGTQPDPKDVEDCEVFKARWAEMSRLLREIYLTKYILKDDISGLPEPPPPDPHIIRGSLGNLINQLNIKDHLINELILDALKNNSSFGPGIFNEFNVSEIQIMVVNELIQKFDDAANDLRKELLILEKNAKQRK